MSFITYDKFTYGRTVKKALAAFGIKLKNTEWQPLVVDRAAWKAATGSDKFLGRCGSSRNHPRRPASAHIGKLFCRIKRTNLNLELVCTGQQLPEISLRGLSSLVWMRVMT